MNSKMILAVVGLGAVGYVVYKYMVQPQLGSTSVSPFSQPSNQKLSGQPSEQYPIQPIISPRVDNSNQPWYGGSRSSNDTPDKSLGGVDSNFLANVQTIGALDDVSKSLGSLWDSFSNYFTDDNANAEVAGINWDSISEPSNYWNA